MIPQYLDMFNAIPSLIRAKTRAEYQSLRSSKSSVTQAGITALNNNAVADLHITTALFHYIGYLIITDKLNRFEPFCFVEMCGKNQLYEFVMKSTMLNEYEVLFRLNFIYHLTTQQIAGDWIYEVSPGLAQALKETELHGLTTDDLRLPYPSIYLDIPLQAGLKVWHEDSGWHNVIGAFITEDPKLFKVSDNAKIDLENLDKYPTCRSWRIMLVGAPKGKMEYMGEEIENDALSYFNIDLTSGLSLEQSVESLDKQIKKDPNFGEMKLHWKEPFTWIMNAVLYATNVEKGREFFANKDYRQLQERISKLPPSNKKDDLKSRLKGMNPQRRVLLGEKITVRRNDTEATTMGSEGHPLTVKLKVAGHWKHVCYGHQNSLRRLQWINPYWKGPEDGVFAPKVHSLT